MALSRACMLGRSFISRGSSARIASSVFQSSRVAIAIPQRQFASVSRLQQEVVQDQSSASESSTIVHEIPETLRKKNARSIFVAKFPKRTTRAELEALVKDNGFEILDMDMRMDRFNFRHVPLVHIELANKEQALEAITKLNRNKSLGEELFVKPTAAYHVWESVREGEPFYNRPIHSHEAGLDAAIQPLLDGRRLQFLVLPPGWANLRAPLKVRDKANREVVVQALKPFGIETVGQCSPNWGDKKKTPRHLCFVDMKTKEGAEEAISKIHNTIVHGHEVGLKVSLKKSILDGWKAYTLGKLSKEKLTMLQEKGMAPSQEEMDENEDRYSKPRPFKRVNLSK